MKYAFSYISVCLGKCRQPFCDYEEHLNGKSQYVKGKRTEEIKAQSFGASDDS